MNYWAYDLFDDKLSIKKNLFEHPSKIINVNYVTVNKPNLYTIILSISPLEPSLMLLVLFYKKYLKKSFVKINLKELIENYLIKIYQAKLKYMACLTKTATIV